MSSMVGLLGLVIGLCITFLPSALAILRGNVFKGQVIKFQIINLVITIVVVTIIFIFGLVTPAKNVHHEMSDNMLTVTDDVTTTMAEMQEAQASVSSIASETSIISIICFVVGGIWGLISIVLWFYILIHALRDQQMALLSRFGINF